MKLKEAIRRLRASDPTLKNADFLFENIGDEQATELADALSTNSTVTELWLGGHEIGDEGAAALADALRCNSVLTELHMDDNKIGKGAAAMADALCTNSTLTRLGLCSNEIGRKGAVALADALRTNSTLAVLWLAWNCIGDVGVAALAGALRTNSTLNVLELGANKIGDDGAEALAGALRANSTLTELRLGGNGIGNEIGDKGAAALADALCTNSALSVLCLDSNEIGDKGAAALADALHCNFVLTYLHLSGNKIGNVGAAALEDALRTNSALIELRLDSNEIGDEGAAALAHALRANSTLSVLHLDSNEIGNVGAAALADALRANSALTVLYSNNKKIGNEGAAALADALRTNSTLTKLTLYGKKIGNCLNTKINRLLDINKKSSSVQEADRKKAAEFGPSSAELHESDEPPQPGMPQQWSSSANQTSSAVAYPEQDFQNPNLHHLMNVRQQDGYVGPPVPSRQKGSGDYWVKQAEHHNLEAQLRQDVKCHQEMCVAGEGISYFISLDRSKSFPDNRADLGVGQLVWNTDRVKQAAAGDGSSLSGLLMALQWIVGKYTSGKQCSFEDVLPPPPSKLSLALGTPEALKSLVDRKLDGEDEPSILHIVCAAEDGCALLVSQILVEDLGAEFDSIKDNLGRSARTIALANNNPEIIAWALRVGTLLGRYRIDQGPPIHKSGTCKVVSATEVAEEVTKQRQVALKIVAESAHYERELEVRLVHRPGSGVNISSDWNRFQEVHVLKLHRYHNEIDLHSNERVMCLVMPLADRSLDGIIRAEHVAGRELYLIKHIAVAAARALHHLHFDHGIVHADFKPRNVVRLGSQFNLIDFDSSVRIGDPVDAGKVSTGYCPPELAKVIFSHHEGLEKLTKQRDDMRSDFDLAGIQSDRVRAIIEEELKSIEETIARLEMGEMDPPKAHPTLDIWAFGVVMYFMFTGVCLFQCNMADNLVGADEERKLVQWKGLRNDQLRSVLADCPGATGAEIRAAKDLLRKCLKPDPRDRPQSMAEVLRMPFLDSSTKSDLTARERNSIHFLFSGPLVFEEYGELCPVKWLNFERERDLLVQCLRNVKKDVKLSFDAATVQCLQELAGRRCGCLHFTGHGKPSYLVFEDGSGGAHFLSIDGLRKLIPRREAFQFVFVAACHSQAIGQAFVDAGVPHVLCCELKSHLLDDAAAEFTRSFYCELAKGSTVKEAFDSASAAVHVRHGGAVESQKYMLLPSHKDHGTSIFDADDIEEFNEENKVETALPAPPVDFEGRQIFIYEVVSEVLSDSGKAHFIYLVGKNHTSRRYLLSATCHYVNDRLSTTSVVKKILYAKPNAAGIEDSDASILNSLYEQLKPEEGAMGTTSDSPENSICKALNGSKTLIVLDGVGDADSLCSLLNSLCNVAGRVKVLISAEKKPAFSYPAAETVLHVDDLS